MPRSRPASTPYHHGDLRSALLREALAADSLETVSLRQLAAHIGVTAAAVYRHFESKEALLRTLAGLGFDRLHAAFAAAFSIDEPPADASAARLRLQRLGVAYLDFASAEPALWRLMFGTLGGAYRTSPPQGGRQSTFDYLPAAILGLYRTGVLASPPKQDDVLFSWSTIHGLAGLRAGGIPLAQGPAERIASEAVDRVIAALSAVHRVERSNATA